MKSTILSLATIALFTVTGFSQTANVNNNIESVYMSNGSTLLNSNSEYYLGTFGGLSDSAIQGLFSADSAANYNALFSNFSILGSIRNPDAGGFGFSFAPEANEISVPFNGNEAPSFFDGKSMQVVILGSVNGQNSAGNLLQVGIYKAWDFDNSLAINFETADAFDVNNFAFAGVDTMASDQFKIGAKAILGTGGDAGTSFTLSTTTVPEPSSSALLLIGSTALLALRRLKKNV